MSLEVKSSWNPKLVMEDLAQMRNLCAELLKTKHYAQLGEVGIFAVVQKAKALNVNPIEALNGGLYCVNGKVEMSANLMMQLIRGAGHSVTKDKRSDDTICILHGKRKDNGDTWTESFSIADAKRAGVYRNVWEKFPRNMLFARALSNLARQLFADVLKGCYVEGEISQSTPIDANVEAIVPDMPMKCEDYQFTDINNLSTSAEVAEIGDILNQLPENIQEGFWSYLDKGMGGIKSLNDIPAAQIEGVKKALMKKLSTLEEVTV